MNFGKTTLGQSDLQRVDKGENYAYLDKYTILHVVDPKTIDTVKENDPNVKAILKKIDCYAGYPVIGDQSILGGICEEGKVMSCGFLEIEDLIYELIKL